MGQLLEEKHARWEFNEDPPLPDPTAVEMPRESACRAHVDAGLDALDRALDRLDAQDFDAAGALLARALRRLTAARRVCATGPRVLLDCGEPFAWPAGVPRGVA